MSLWLPRREVWTRQPTGQITIVPRWRDNMKFCYLPMPGREIKRPLIGPALYVNGSLGTLKAGTNDIHTYLNFNNSDALYSLAAGSGDLATSTGDGNGDFSAFVYFKMQNTVGTVRTLLSQRDNASPFEQFAINCNSPTAADLYAYVYDGAYEVQFQLADGITDEWQTVSLSRLNGFATCMLDGIQVETTKASSGTIWTSDGSRWGLGVSPLGYSPGLNYRCALAWASNRGLSLAEQKSLHENPWQIFE